MQAAQFLSNLNLFANPILIKSARARLRLKHILSWGTIVLSITTFVCLITYLTPSQRDWITEQEAARSLLIPLVIIQAILLMGLGTGQVASGLARERMGLLLDYQRMTPMSPTAKILGYLFGLPVREYFLFALTLPFVGFAVIKGQFPLDALAEFYIVFFSSVWVYHMTGLVAGMATPRPMLASGLAVGMVFVLYFILPRLEMFGFELFEHLTMLPTLIGVLLEHMPTADQMARDPFWDASRIGNVEFYQWAVHPTVFTLIVQGFLLMVLFSIVHRKWKDEFLHPLSKISATLAFVGTTVILTGNLWPIIGDSDVYNTMVRRMPMNEGAVAPAFVLLIIMNVFLLISGFLSLLFVSLTTPSRHTALKGVELARKLGRMRIPFNADAASSLPLSLLMIAITSAACIALIGLARDTGRFFIELPPITAAAAPLLLHSVVLLFVQGLRERFSGRAFIVGTFLLWMLPLFACMIIWSAREEWLAGSYIGLPFPPLAQAMAIYHFFHESTIVAQGWMEYPEALVNNFANMTWLAIGFYGLLAALLQFERYRFRSILQQSPNVAAALADDRSQIDATADALDLDSQPEAAV